jgi:hypothetical protein
LGITKSIREGKNKEQEKKMEQEIKPAPVLPKKEYVEDVEEILEEPLHPH